ncbi:MAG: hypothetical protein NDJ92_12985 [Thermoanaerobaculia bacterium]|nr:hypothetical protein [Thermoanaerobaculia bacterium]
MSADVKDLLFNTLPRPSGRAQPDTGPVQVFYDDRYIAIDDAEQIPADLRAYVQVVLYLNLMNAYFRIEQGPLDLAPTIRATFEPSRHVTRSAYAVTAVRFCDGYLADLTE